MNAGTLKRILALGAITGMRSMAGAATLAVRERSSFAPVATLLAAGEMAADKTSFVGNRTDTVPQTGRAVMGALVGGFIAREEGQSMLLGALAGAAAALAMTHLAYQMRTRLPLSSGMAGLLEDALVVGAGSLYTHGTLRRRRVR